MIKRGRGKSHNSNIHKAISNDTDLEFRQGGNGHELYLHVAF